MTISAIEAAGIEDAWAAMQDLRTWREEHAVWQRTRQMQAAFWLHEDVRQGLLQLLQDDPQTANRMKAAEAAVSAGKVTPAAAAETVLAPLRARPSRE